MDMICRVFGLAALMVFAPGDAFAQAADPLSRQDRVVIHSPHFDEPDPTRGHLNCSARPLRLFGTESGPSGTESVPSLAVRVVRYVEPELGVTRFESLPGAMVQLTHHVAEDGDRELPRDPDRGGRTDADGIVIVRAPVGTYRLRLMGMGFRGGEGLIRIRDAPSDTVHAYMDVAAIC